MNQRFCCVVDAQGWYREYVLVVLTHNKLDEMEWKIQHYTLMEGETLINATPPNFKIHAGAKGYIRPCWDDSTWGEGATSKEITQWELDHPAPPLASPSPQEDSDALLIDHEYHLTLLELGVG